MLPRFVFRRQAGNGDSRRGIPVTEWLADRALKSSVEAGFSHLRYVVVKVAI